MLALILTFLMVTLMSCNQAEQRLARSSAEIDEIKSLITDFQSGDLIDLSECNIGQYDYENKNQSDDFLKTFFDRITDCLKIEKETGRKLRGKNMAAISCGIDSFENEGFFIPFEKSAEYLGMKYFGHIHTWIEENDPSNSVLELIKDFSKKLK